MGYELNLRLDTPVGSVPLSEPFISAYSSQTIGELKSDIQDTNDIPYNEQILLYSRYILEDSRTLESYGIQDGNKVQLIVRRPGKLPVIFHVNGKEITLHLQLSDSVFKIKQLLAAKGYTVTTLMLGSARIDDNATVEKAKLIPFSSVYCT